MKLLTLIMVLFSFSSWAHDLDPGNYLKMQETLSNDNFESAVNAHQQICEKELLHYTDTYKDCKKKFKDIDQLRASFKSLSTLYIEHGEKGKMKGLMIAECPMAKAKWIQKEGKIQNPYYGKSMLECGGKVSKI